MPRRHNTTALNDSW